MLQKCLGASAALVISASLAQAGTTHEVDIVGDSFFPPLVYAEEGDTIVWKNNSPSTHTATASDESWTTGDIPPGGTASIELEEEMTLSYASDYNYNATGSITYSEPD